MLELFAELPLSIPMSRVVTGGFGAIMFETPLVLVPAAAAVIGWRVLVGAALRTQPRREAKAAGVFSRSA